MYENVLSSAQREIIFVSGLIEKSKQHRSKVSHSKTQVRFICTVENSTLQKKSPKTIASRMKLAGCFLNSFNLRARGKKQILKSFKIKANKQLAPPDPLPPKTQTKKAQSKQINKTKTNKQGKK